MGLKILAWSHSLTQYNEYGKCQKQILPRINRQSEHEVIQLAVEGMHQSPPITVRDVKLYPHSEYGGNAGEGDVEYIVQSEDVDIILVQLDVTDVAGAIQALGNEPQMPPIVVYSPIDHHGPEYMSAPIVWRNVFESADVHVPYCEFGRRVMEEHDLDGEALRDPIYHGVDTEAFSPKAGENPFELREDDFLIGYFKPLQMYKGGHDRALRSFREFLDAEDAWDNAYIYMHCSKQGSGDFNLPVLISEFGLSDNIILPTPTEYRWFADRERMAMLYSACDVLLNTSRGEGFGLPILEAMACGTSVIAGAYSSMPELVLGEEGEITHDDVDDPVIDAPRGWLVPTWDERMTMGKYNYARRYNSDHIVEALGIAYNNPDEREKKGRRGREFAAEHTWPDKANQFISLFDQLEDELWETDETTGIEWETIGEEGAEHGGVGGLGGVGEPR